MSAPPRASKIPSQTDHPGSGARSSGRLPARTAPAIVWTVWATMLLAVLVAIGKDGPTIPRAEDWLLVPALTGNEPSLAAWLWEQNSEHRVPVPRLAYLAVLKLGGGDFRSGMVFNTLSMAILAGAMILTAGRIRGRTAYADAFFPLALLHLGHWHNLVWGWQIQFVLSTLFVSIVLLAIVTRGMRLGPGPAALAGACLVLLPLCGANGLVFVPALALWLGASGLLAWRRGDESHTRGMGIVLLAVAAVALVLTGVYFLAYERAPWYPPSPGPGATLATSAKFLAMAFGPAAAASWPISVLAIFAVLAASLVILVSELWRAEIRERQRVVAVLVFLGAVGALALAVGWGRAGRAATAGLNSRYALLAVPLLCAVYFAWELYGHPRWRPVVRTALLIVMVALLPVNTLHGLAARDWVQTGMNAVERDIAAGMPRILLAERHYPFLLHWDQQRLASGMEMLRRANFGAFARLQDTPVEEIAIAVGPDTGGPARRLQAATQSDSPLAVTLGAPRRVFAVRVQTNHKALVTDSPSSVRLAWRADERLEAHESNEMLRPDPASGGGASTATVWINEVIDRFQIRLVGRDAWDSVRLTVLASAHR